MKTQTKQVYFIYIYDPMHSWVKCGLFTNPKDGFEYEQEAVYQLMIVSEQQIGREFTIMSVWKTINT